MRVAKVEARDRRVQLSRIEGGTSSCRPVLATSWPALGDQSAKPRPFALIKGPATRASRLAAEVQLAAGAHHRRPTRRAADGVAPSVRVFFGRLPFLGPLRCQSRQQEMSFSFIVDCSSLRQRRQDLFATSRPYFISPRPERQGSLEENLVGTDWAACGLSGGAGRCSARRHHLWGGGVCEVRLHPTAVRRRMTDPRRRWQDGRRREQV